HDREGLADILLRGVAKAFSADAVEAEADHWLVVLERRLGIDQHVAADDDPLAQEVVWRLPRTGRALLARQDFAPPRHSAATSVLDRHRLVYQLEGQLCRLAEQRLHMLRIIDAGQLDKDPVLPLALDCRFLGAGLVDAAADDLDRLVDRLAAALLRRLR